MGVKAGLAAGRVARLGQEGTMTESEWLACEAGDYTDWDVLLRVLRGKVSDRKLRLFACACCRHFGEYDTDSESTLAVQTAERFADGLANAAERDAVLDALPPGLATDITPDGFIPTPVAASLWADASEAARQAAHTATLCVYGYPSYPGVAKDVMDDLRDIFGNPFRPVTIDPAWRTATVTSLAQAIYDERAFERMPVLADALEDAGCTSQEMLEHCRGGEHVRGCWVVDLVLGKE